MRNIARCMALLLLALPCGSDAQETVYVQSLTTRITAAPAFGAPVVAEARRGDALRVIESQERWYKVALNAKTGWVPRLVVADRAPLPRTSALQEEAAAGGSVSARRRASAATTAGAARGLTYDDRTRASHGALANYDALEKVERIAVTEQEALAFVAEGMKQ